MRLTRGLARWTVLGVACGLAVIGLGGCGEGAGILVGTIVASSTDDDEPPSEPTDRPSLFPRYGAEAVSIKRTRLVATPGGCEIEVTYQNVTDRSLSVGFTYRTFDAQGRELKALSTPVSTTRPRETRTLASGNTTAGPSGIPCGQIARTELKSVGAYGF